MVRSSCVVQDSVSMMFGLQVTLIVHLHSRGDLTDLALLTVDWATGPRR